LGPEIPSKFALAALGDKVPGAGPAAIRCERRTNPLIARNVNCGLLASAGRATLPAMTNTSIRWGLAVGTTLLAEVAMIALSVICVAVYSYTIRTGESQEFYNAFAQASGPWVSLITGGPVFYMIARWIRKRAQAPALATAMTMCGLYLAIEIAVILAWPGDTSGVMPFMIGGMAVKVAGAWLGASGTAARAVADSPV
jgi:hypothetical protein